MGRVRESRRQLRCTYRGRGINLHWNLFCFTSKPSWLYNIPDAHTNSQCFTSSLLSRHSTWTYLLLACHPHKFPWSHLQLVAYTMHVITLPSSTPPMQFLRHLCWEDPSSVYLRYRVHFLLFLFLVSDFHSCINRCWRGLKVNAQQ